MVKAIPAGAHAAQISIVGVSVSLDTRQGNLELALDRAKTIVRYLEKQHIKGDYSITVSTRYDKPGTAGTARQAAADVRPVTTVDGKPLTTASISFLAPTS